MSFLSTHRHIYQRSDPIILTPDMVLEIERGVVMKTVIHLDGAEVLLGLHGAGQLMTPHPEDSCHIRLEAHTEVYAQLITWPQALHLPNLAERLRAQIWQQEAWAAMQARPAYEDRLLGILNLLAEQFGVSEGDGTLIDLRITHQQLANAIGATRSTITRLLSDLRHRQLITNQGSGNQERICLRHRPDQLHR